jgi:hypothetical protein
MISESQLSAEDKWGATAGPETPDLVGRSCFREKVQDPEALDETSRPRHKPTQNAGLATQTAEDIPA